MDKSGRNRPRISQTIAADTLDMLRQISEEQALPNIGVVIDFITHDWVKIKRATIHAAAPTITEHYIFTDPNVEVRS